jgi:hypothetical protein
VQLIVHVPFRYPPLAQKRPVTQSVSLEQNCPNVDADDVLVVLSSPDAEVAPSEQAALAAIKTERIEAANVERSMTSLQG